MLRHFKTNSLHVGLARYSAGFSLLELMVAMFIGVIIIGGAFGLHANSRGAQTNNEDQMDMVADARFAIETIAYDLRHAGVWGATNKDALIECKSTDSACTSTSNGDTPPSSVSGDCTVGWYYDLSRPIFATDNTSGNPYSSTCIPSSESYLAGTDVLEVKYADANETTSGNLLANQVYVRSNFINGRVFVGATEPKLSAYDSSSLTKNHELHAYAYYISDYTDSSGDGIPSLRRVALVNNPGVENQVLASGVVDLQVQLGEDVDDLPDSTGYKNIDRYVDPNQVTDWANIYAAKIWLVLRTDDKQKGVDTKKTFDIAGVSKTYGGQDGYRYFLVTSVVDMRNMRQF